MKLTELEPRFMRYIEDEKGIFLQEVDTLAETQGVWFLCPKCFQANGGKVGTHAVLCWSRSRGTPEHAEPKPGRWTLDGASMEDLTLNGDQPGDNPSGGARSVLLTGGCGWHGFITNGEAT